MTVIVVYHDCISFDICIFHKSSEMSAVASWYICSDRRVLNSVHRENSIGTIIVHMGVCNQCSCIGYALMQLIGSRNFLESVSVHYKTSI